MLTPIFTRRRPANITKKYIETLLEIDTVPNDIEPFIKIYKYIINIGKDMFDIDNDNITENIIVASFKLLSCTKNQNKPDLENIIYEYFEKIITTVQNMDGFEKNRVLEIERLHQTNIAKNTKLQDWIIKLQAELEEYDYLPTCGYEYISLMTNGHVFDMYKAFNNHTVQNNQPVKTHNFFGVFQEIVNVVKIQITKHGGLFNELNIMTKQQESERTNMYCKIENLELQLKMTPYKLICGSKYLDLLSEDFPDLNIHSFDFFKTFLKIKA